MVQGLLGLLRVEPALPEQKPQKLFVFGIHAHDGVRRMHESGAVVGDDLELPIAINVVSQRQRLASLATSQSMTLEKLRHNGDTHAKASRRSSSAILGRERLVQRTPSWSGSPAVWGSTICRKALSIPGKRVKQRWRPPLFFAYR